MDPLVETIPDATYSHELYIVLVSVTSGAAKSVGRSVVDKGFGQYGFNALVEFQRRFDAKSAASMMHAYMEVVGARQIK